MNLKVSKRLTALAVIVIFIAGFSTPSFSQQGRPRYNSRTNTGGGWTLPPDTIISMQMDRTLSSKTSRVGDRFTATVTVPVSANGRVALPPGTVIEGRVTQVTPAKRMSKAGMIAIDFDSIILADGRRLALVGSLTSDDPEIRDRIDDENSVKGANSDRKAVFVGGSGTIGAVLGGIAGGGKGAIIGGVAGAGIGVAGVLLSKGEEAEVRAGTPFGIQLRQALSMRDDPGYDNSAGSNDPSNDPGDNDPRAIDPRSRSNRDSGPAYDRSNRRDTEPRDYPEKRVEPGQTDPDESETEPVRDPEPMTRPETTSSEPEPVAEALPLSSTEMIRRAQVALKEQGYYEGQTDGVMSPRTSNSLKTFQRENNLPQTGDLDPATANKLGITKAGTAAERRESRPVQRETRPVGNPNSGEQASSDRVVLANVLSATANRTPDGALFILVNTQANTGGWRWFGEQVANGDTLEVYARAVKPTGIVTQGLTRGKIELNVKDGVDLVRRVVVHGAAGNITIPLGSNSRPAETGNMRSGDTQPATINNIQRQAEQLLAEYKRLVGVRSSGSQTEIDARYGDAEIELLFALDSFANAARLHAGLTGRSATLALAREARKTDRVITTTSSSLAGAVSRGWDTIRLEVLRLMKTYNIQSSDIDN
jgi:hypothetical protein